MRGLLMAITTRKSGLDIHVIAGATVPGLPLVCLHPDSLGYIGLVQEGTAPDWYSLRLPRRGQCEKLLQAARAYRLHQITI